MNIVKALKAIKTASAVYGYVKLTDHDGQYIKLVKADILRTMVIYTDGMIGGLDIDVEVTVTDNIAYIN